MRACVCLSATPPFPLSSSFYPPPPPESGCAFTSSLLSLSAHTVTRLVTVTYSKLTVHLQYTSTVSKQNGNSVLGCFA